MTKRYRVVEIAEVMREWFVEAANEEEAENLVYGPLGEAPDRETGEQIDMTVEELGS